MSEVTLSPTFTSEAFKQFRRNGTMNGLVRSSSQIKLAPRKEATKRATEEITGGTMTAKWNNQRHRPQKNATYRGVDLRTKHLNSMPFPKATALEIPGSRP